MINGSKSLSQHMPWIWHESKAYDTHQSFAQAKMCKSRTTRVFFWLSDWPITARRMQKKNFRNRTRSIWESCKNFQKCHRLHWLGTLYHTVKYYSHRSNTFLNIDEYLLVWGQGVDTVKMFKQVNAYQRSSIQYVDIGQSLEVDRKW